MICCVMVQCRGCESYNHKSSDRSTALPKLELLHNFVLSPSIIGNQSTTSNKMEGMFYNVKFGYDYSPSYLGATTNLRQLH